LLIWPETALPTYLLQEDRHRAMVQSFIDSLKIPVLTGIPYLEEIKKGEYVYFNSATLIKPMNNEYPIYSKIHLVPMSERIPFSERYKILKDIHLGQADFSSGREMTIFDLDGIKFATLICFESAFPGYCRQFSKMGAQFLVVITNDMWFGRTSLYEQHAMMSVFRAIENRIPVARAGNTGISLAVDKYGHILMKSGTFTMEFLSTAIYPEDSKSVYGEVGDIIPEALSVVSLISIVIAFLTKKKYFRSEVQ
jgi:apolipoprotein N-acyltransferase